MSPDQLAEILVLTIKQSLAPVQERLARLEGGQVAGEQRVAALEARGLVPGPPGPAGQDGQDGQDGAAGLGFEDLDVTYDGDRTLTLRFERGGAVKAFPITLPIPRYAGVYTAGATYTTGDLVTYGGSTWYCRTPTASKPGESGAAWQLMVKRGRDGRGA